MSLRLLHTSDWHLGISYEGVSRRADHTLFFEWLRSTLIQEEVELLLIAGDVFDQHNPAAEALELWYAFLASLEETPVRDVVVIAGNHDSAARIEAPGSVLDRVGVHVRGRFVDDWESKDRLLIPVALDEEGQPAAVVLAVPYVHEYRLGIRTTLSESEDLGAAFDARFTRLYSELTDRAVERFGDVPLIGMGHLTCSGANPEDSPHAIHMVGGIGGLPESIFDDRLSYVALGHIHRMMPVGTGRAWYSGTPIAMNIKEARTQRQVLLVDVGSVRPVQQQAKPVPSMRDIRVLVGTPDAVIQNFEELTWAEPLPPLLNVELEVDKPDLSESVRVREAFARAFSDVEERPHLVRVHQRLEGSSEDGVRESLDTVRVRDLAPEDVFVRLCAHSGIEADAQLLNAFRSVLGAEGAE